MKKLPKRVKVSYYHDGIDYYGLKGKEEYKPYDITKQVEKVHIMTKKMKRKKKRKKQTIIRKKWINKH